MNDTHERGLMSWTQDKVDDLKNRIVRDIRIGIARENIDVSLSRWKDLDPDKAASIDSARELLGL